VPPRVVDPRAEAISKAVEQYVVDPAPSGVDPRAEAISHAVEQYGKEVMDPRAQIISDAVDQYSRMVELELGCTGGCTGTAEITAGGSAAPRAVATASARKVLAKLKFRVPAGKPRKIRIALPPKARKALAKARGAKVKVTLKAKNGPTRSRTLALRKRR
jgi:predicted flavoprotein YhiN